MYPVYYLCCVVLLSVDLGPVTGYPTESLDKVPQGFRDVANDDFDDFEDNANVYQDRAGSTVRTRRSVSTELQDFRDTMLAHLNAYRRQLKVPEFVLDPTLERGAQAWALAEASEFNMTASCHECHDYAEVLGKRRSSHPIPDGSDAANWAYPAIFDADEDGNLPYDNILGDPEYRFVGVGITFAQNPDDASYHAYPVMRFAIPAHQ